MNYIIKLACEKSIDLVAQLVRVPACHAGGRGFDPLPGRQYLNKVYVLKFLSNDLSPKDLKSSQINGQLAQSVEQRTENPRVPGSIPGLATNTLREWLSGRASPCQGERREFESRLPLQRKKTHMKASF